MLLIVGFLFMILLIASIGQASSMIAFFIDLPSALLILVPLLFFIFVSKSGSIIGGYIMSSFKKNYAYTKGELERIALTMKNTIKFILAVGGFSFIAGLIGCFGYLGAPERLGPNLAISLVTLIYSIAVSFFMFFPVQAWAENRAAPLTRDSE